jgi:hypothetical protein
MIELPLQPCATVLQFIQLAFSGCNEIEKPTQHVGGNFWRCHFPPEHRQVPFNIADTLIKVANSINNQRAPNNCSQVVCPKTGMR